MTLTRPRTPVPLVGPRSQTTTVGSSTTRSRQNLRSRCFRPDIGCRSPRPGPGHICPRQDVGPRHNRPGHPQKTLSGPGTQTTSYLVVSGWTSHPGTPESDRDPSKPRTETCTDGPQTQVPTVGPVPRPDFGPRCPRLNHDVSGHRSQCPGPDHEPTRTSDLNILGEAMTPAIYRTSVTPSGPGTPNILGRTTVLSEPPNQTYMIGPRTLDCPDCPRLDLRLWCSRLDYDPTGLRIPTGLRTPVPLVGVDSRQVLDPGDYNRTEPCWLSVLNDTSGPRTLTP